MDSGSVYSEERYSSLFLYHSFKTNWII
jgi:hypothetical protein